ncbi:MAG: hypothetical protein U0746_02890 [Gemmataceae bacterium]
MPGTTNRARARRFAAALRAYGTDDTDPGCLTDLLADARHWCDSVGQCYADLDRIAYGYYVAELWLNEIGEEA